MAPIKPRAVIAHRARSSYPAANKTFSSTKRDKRIMKHSILVSKARNSSDKSSGVKKRRRPSKKLVASMSSLASVLPTEFDDSLQSQSSKTPSQTSISQSESLKSQRGSKKKLQRVVKDEQARFGKNLAVLSQAATTSTASSSANTSASEPDTRWAALRKHLNGTIGIS